MAKAEISLVELHLNDGVDRTLYGVVDYEGYFYNPLLGRLDLNNLDNTTINYTNLTHIGNVETEKYTKLFNMLLNNLNKDSDKRGKQIKDKMKLVGFNTTTTKISTKSSKLEFARKDCLFSEDKDKYTFSQSIQIELRHDFILRAKQAKINIKNELNNFLGQTCYRLQRQFEGLEYYLAVIELKRTEEKTFVILDLVWFYNKDNIELEKNLLQPLEDIFMSLHNKYRLF